MNNLEVNAPVKVAWKESGSSFTGIITNINEDGSYDVLYDEKIGDKACLEKQVAKSRIESDRMEVVDIHQGEQNNQTPTKLDSDLVLVEDSTDTDYWIDDTNTESYKSTSDRSKTVSKLIQVSESSAIEEAVAAANLDNHEVLLLHDALTPRKAMELFAHNMASVSTLVSLLTASVDANCSENHAQACYAELWAEYIEEGSYGGKNKVGEWVSGMSLAEDSPLSGILALCGALAGLLRLQAACNRSQTLADQSFSILHRSASAVAGGTSVHIAEETLDRALRCVSTFLNVNYLNAMDSKPSTSVGSGKVKTKAKENVNNKAVADVAKIVFPVVTSVLSALELCFRSGRQSERMGLSVAELALAVLRTDPVAAPVLEALPAGNAVLPSLHRAACGLLREVFVQNTSHRKGLLMEMLAQLSQSYAAKTPYRSFPLGSSNSAVGESGKYATMGLVALLGCLQSVVNVSESLVVKKHKSGKGNSSAPEPAAANAPASASKGKSKKNAKGSAKKTTDEDAGNLLELDAPSDRKSDHTLENAKKSIIQCYVCCSAFATDLFQRYTHKEVSGDYRNLASNLVTDLLALIQLPTWPVAAILLEQILLCVLKQLHAAEMSDGGTAKKDASYTPFLLDLLGGACVGLRTVLVTAEQERRAAEGFSLSPAVLASLEKKVAALRPDWVASVRSHQPPVTDSPPKKASGKTPKSKGSSEHSNSNSNSNSPSSRGQMDISCGLDALLEVTSSTIDAVSEAPLYAGAASFADLDLNDGSMEEPSSHQSPDFAALPPPVEILSLLPDGRELIGLFPEISPLDLQYHHVCVYLQGVVESNAAEAGGDVARDALESCLSMWYLNAATEDHSEVADHLYRRLEQFNAYKSGSQLTLLTGKKPPALSISSSSSRWMASNQDTAVRGNFSIEAVLSANRSLLAARSVNAMFERVLDAILSLSTDSVPGVRAKAVKMLSPLLQCDNDLIQRDNIRFAVTNRLLDRAISVREESVKLLGYYVVRGYQNLAAAYLEGLKERLHDEGISVRKSVVLLFKEILLNQPDHPQYTELCLSLLEKASHPKEEESIREIIRLTFQQIWFLAPSATAVQTSLRLKRQSSSNGLHAASSCNSLTQQFSAFCATPSGSISVPGLSRTSSFQLNEEGREGRDSTVISPLSQQSSPRPPGGHLNSLTVEFSSPTDQSLTIDTRALAAEGSSEMDRPSPAGPFVSNRTTPAGRTPTAAQRSFSGVVSPKEALQDHIRSTALQLVDMAALDDATEWMVSLLREMLHGSSEGDEGSAQLKQRRAGSFKYCEQIVAQLIELLLCTEEQQPQIMQLLLVRGKDPKVQAVNIIRTVALFCTAHPPFISKHLKTLLPYLKHDNSYTKEQNALIKLKVTEIVTSTASIDSSAFSFNLTELVSDLKKCALTLSGKNIRAAINCLALLAENVTKDALPLFQLADTCFRGIRSIATAVPDNSMLSAGHLGNLQRCLIVFGYVCECAKLCAGAMETFVASFNQSSPELKNLTNAARSVYLSAQVNNAIAKRDISAVELLHPSALQGSCYAAAIYALTVPHAVVQIRGAQALCGVFAGCPRLMLLAQQEGLLTALLGENYDDAVHERFIMAVKDMMVLEEERLEANQALRLMKDSGVAVVESDVVMGNLEQDAESTIPGFALQQHLPELTAFLAHKSPSLRFTTLQLVGTLLRQGMLCPIDVVAPLIALQCDIDAKIRHEALTILQIEDEKHPTFIGNRMVDGIELCHSFQLRTQGSYSTLDRSLSQDPRKGSVAMQRISLLGDFFSSCVQHPKRRKELLDGLLHRSYRIITKLREDLAQHPRSYDVILQQQAQQNKLLKEEQQSALMALAAENGEASATEGSNSIVPASAIKRSSSFPSSSSSGARGKKDSPKLLLHLLSVLDAYDKAGASDFIASTLAYLPYEVVEEPLQLVYYINRNVAVGTSLLLHRLRQQMLSMGGQLRKCGEMQPPVLGTKPRGGAGKASLSSPNPQQTSATAARPFLDNSGPLEGDVDLLVSEEAFFAWLKTAAADEGDASTKPRQGPSLAVVRMCELIVLALELRCNEAVLRLKSFIKLTYSLSDDRCSSFNPDERSLSLSAAAAAANNTVDKLSMSNTALAYQPHPPGIPDITDILTSKQVEAFVSGPSKFCDSSVSSAAKDGGDATATLGKSALLALVRQVAMDYNRITLLLNSDPEDFTLSAASTQAGAAGAKRKRKAATADGAEKKPAAGRKPKVSPAAAKGGGTVPKKKAKKPRRALTLGPSDDEEDAEPDDASDDENWEDY